MQVCCASRLPDQPDTFATQYAGGGAGITECEQRGPAHGAPGRYDGWMQGWRLEHTYAGLPALFHARAEPAPVASPRMLVFNTGLAEAMGLDAAALDTPEGAAVLAGNVLPPGAHPIAQAYAGHQFGYFTTLGDGRAILLGEQITPDGRRLDVQLKGAGRTRYSRRGDGRAAIGPMLREYVISEAMHALGIPTTRSLAVVATGEPVYRERVLSGAVLTRVAASHLRVGTFEWAAAEGGPDAVRALADYARGRHYAAAVGEEAWRDLFDAIAERQASLIAQWQLVGFVHGVMNTDNMAISGETIDYGPCAFMDTYDPETVFSSIDADGRYAYGNQPGIAQWNLARLAETLLPLLADNRANAIDIATEAVARFAGRFQDHWLLGMRAKLGLLTVEADDARLADALLAWMQERRADYSETFRQLASPGEAEAMARSDAAFAEWHARWLARLARQPQGHDDVVELMRRSNPVVIARNHKVEEALTAAEQDDLAPLERLLGALRAPYDYARAPVEFRQPPPGSTPAYRTFCGT